MAKKVLAFIREQAIKAGVDVNVDTMKTFFENASFAELEIPEEISKPVETSFITITDAKNNHPDIKNHYISQSLDGLDKKLKTLMDDNQLTADEINGLLVERNTYARTENLIKLLAAKATAKANEGKPAQQAIQAQIDDLHAQLRASKTKETELAASFAEKEKQLYIRTESGALLSGYKTVYDTLDPEAKAAAINALIDKRLRDLDAKLDIVDGKLILVKKDGTNVYGDGNTQILPKNLIEQTLSANKLLVTAQNAPTNTGSATNTPANTGHQSGNAPTNGSANKNGATPGFNAAIDKAMADAAQVSTQFGGAAN